MLVQPCLHRDDDFEANAAKISAGVVRILHTLLEGYVPDADAHPGAHVNRDSSANPAAGQAAAGGCAAAGGLQESPVPGKGEQQQQQQQPQHQVRRPRSAAAVALLQAYVVRMKSGACTVLRICTQRTCDTERQQFTHA